MIRTLAIVLGFAVAVLLAVELAAFFEVDSCLDAGGVYVQATGGCSGPREVDYVSQFARPHLYAFWAIFLLLVGLPGWLVYKLGVALGARLTRVRKERLQ